MAVWTRKVLGHRWRVRIVYNCHIYHLGYFDNEIEAAKIYDQKTKEVFGEFAYLNFRPALFERREYGYLWLSAMSILQTIL